MTLKIYVAAAYSAITEAKVRALLLRNRGYEIVSVWHDDDEEGALDTLTLNRKEYWAKKDLEDLYKANVLLVIPPSNSGGIWVEMGVAIAAGIEVLVLSGNPVGEGNVFCWHPRVSIVDSDHALFSLLEMMQR